MIELLKQYIWNPFIYMVYLFGREELWLEEEEKSPHKDLPRR